MSDSAATRHLFPGMGKYADKDECPDRKKHTPMPSGYVAWHEKAEKLRATHAQTQCPTCGFWSIWIEMIFKREGADLDA